MFNFIKKGVSAGERDREKSDRDKERRKKEKKTRKDVKTNIAGNMSSEELLRLDEVSLRLLFGSKIALTCVFNIFYNFIITEKY